jgi:hypothetical protein
LYCGYKPIQTFHSSPIEKEDAGLNSGKAHVVRENRTETQGISVLNGRDLSTGTGLSLRGSFMDEMRSSLLLGILLVKRSGVTAALCWVLVLGVTGKSGIIIFLSPELLVTLAEFLTIE